MADIFNALEEARAEVARLERAIAQGPCIEFGHTWRSRGGMNAGCSRDCGCSVPVHECTKCGDCDYGDNAEAAEKRRQCAELNAPIGSSAQPATGGKS